MAPSLKSVRIAGLTSIDDLTLDLTTPVTVLIGANGAGKSNVVGAFELLGRITDDQLQNYVARRGGFASLLHRSTRLGRSVEQLQLHISGQDETGEYAYEVTLGAARDDEAVVSETVRLGPDDHLAKRASLGSGRKSRLREEKESGTRWTADLARRLLPLLTGCRVFHFDDTSDNAPVKQLVDDADNITLAPDARNLAPLLARLQGEQPDTYRRIVYSVQAVAPFFDDFVLKPEHGRLRLRWREKGLDNVFSADDLSDGTLRFICLNVLLMQPDRPSSIVLDEPELGLHPFAIHQLAALIRSAVATEARVILATQSVTLLSYFDPTEVVVVERSRSGTVANRLAVDELNVWLDEYSLGELWEKNLLGGRPGPDAGSMPSASQ